jgi:hypothetical protein
MNRPLRVFLCHSSNDKPAARELYQKLRATKSTFAAVESLRKNQTIEIK